MIYRIIAFLIGYVRVEVENSERLMSLLVKDGGSLGRITPYENTTRIEFLSLSRKRFISLCENVGAKIISEDRCGLPYILVRYKSRIGVWIGVPVFIFLIYYPSLFIWNIKITGSLNASPEEIISNLDYEGLRIGSHISRLDLPKISTNVLLKNSDISWMAININGTCANVVVRDSVIEKSTREDTPTNLVAVCDGLIERVELFSGQAEVSTGQSVHKGQVLVSGFYQGRNESVYKLERSIGNVYARTTRNVIESVPLVGTRPSPTGNSTIFSSFYFFGKEFSLTSDQSDPYKRSKVFQSSSRLMFFGHPLPIGISRIEYTELTDAEFRISEAEAAAICERSVADKLSKLLKDAQTLGISKSSSCDGLLYTIQIEVYCIEDIAQSVPISDQLSTNKSHLP